MATQHLPDYSRPLQYLPGQVINGKHRVLYRNRPVGRFCVFENKYQKNSPGPALFMNRNKLALVHYIVVTPTCKHSAVCRITLPGKGRIAFQRSASSIKYTVGAKKPQPPVDGTHISQITARPLSISNGQVNQWQTSCPCTVNRL